jgi:hypothetical protein
MTQQNRPEIKVRATRPSDGILYERNYFIAYWLEEGDLENFPDQLISLMPTESRKRH